MALTEVSSNKCFGGYQKVFEHTSMQLGCKMKFGIYLPPKAEQQKCPILYWLSGLTCTEQNFVAKAGAQKFASELGIIVVAPDTSPRGCGVPGEDEAWDLGTGAGFYVDATQEPWSKHYRMYSYVTAELPALLQKSFPVLPDKQSIMGHSMGGHGALVCCLRNPGLYKSVSAFAPICNPVQCPWGQKAFQNYLGDDRDAWKMYDATCLVLSYEGPPLDILVDQGSADSFLTAGQLLPETFTSACTKKQLPVVLRMQEGYDHSYFFISSFIEDHIKHHAKYLLA
uniref:S-formylglutathione hydrolase-like n=1 Tax=Myxine glutinosa TaxID=7769 RepID=UPI00358E66E5